MKKLNEKAWQLSDQGCHIEELIWIAPMTESRRVESLLEDMTEEEISKIHPDIDLSDGFIADQLRELSITGLFAACEHHIQRNIQFDENGDFRGCSISAGKTRPFNVYAETLEELIDLAIVKNEEIAKEEIEYAKRKQATS